MDDVTGVVLAGGHSTRFGSADKASITLDGQPIIQRVVEALRTATTPPPIIAVQTTAQLAKYRAILSKPVQFVTDEPTRDGPLAGVAAALHQVDTGWLFLVGCDMPLLEAEAIRWQLAHRSSSVDAICIQQPVGRMNPLHAGYRKAALSTIASELPPEASLGSILTKLEHVTAIPQDTAPPDLALADSLTDMNTRETFRNLKAK